MSAVTIWAIFRSRVSPARVFVAHSAASSERAIARPGAGAASPSPPAFSAGMNRRTNRNGSAAITAMMRMYSGADLLIFLKGSDLTILLFSLMLSLQNAQYSGYFRCF